jgi:hypothetical protein
MEFNPETENLFDRYYRNELSLTEKAEFEEKLITNSTFREEYNQYLELINGLEQSIKSEVGNYLNKKIEYEKRKQSALRLLLISLGIAVFSFGVIKLIVDLSDNKPNEVADGTPAKKSKPFVYQDIHEDYEPYRIERKNENEQKNKLETDKTITQQGTPTKPTPPSSNNPPSAVDLNKGADTRIEDAEKYSGNIPEYKELNPPRARSDAQNNVKALEDLSKDKISTYESFETKGVSVEMYPNSDSFHLKSFNLNLYKSSVPYIKGYYTSQYIMLKGNIDINKVRLTVEGTEHYVYLTFPDGTTKKSPLPKNFPEILEFK